MNKQLRFWLLAVSLVVLLTPSAFADDSQKMFPFVIEKGAPENITNVQTWAGAFPAAGSDGFIVDRFGEFATDSGFQRLMGTNFCFGASFTTKEKAERVADTLARFGIGVVRLHHMDAYNIWGKNFKDNQTEIDPEQLDRLDYLIYCFHKRGIYVNINLHVSRKFREIDGFENASQLPTQDKGVDNFCRKMIELQKKYAKDLLQHVNPYTGLAYIDDPGVAVVEINNENSVVASWSWGQLNLPSPYQEEFQKYWNEWLLKKYGSDENLRVAWNSMTYPWGEEILPDGVFDESFKFDDKHWRVEVDPQVKYTSEILPPEKSGLDHCALRLTVDEMGTVPWRPQITRHNFALEENKPYRVCLKIRSERNSSLKVSVQEHHEPWTTITPDLVFEAGSEWKDIEFAFISPTTDAKMRVAFSGFKPGDQIDIADLSLKEGGTIGLTDAQTLADGTVPTFARNGGANLMGAKAFADFADFMHDLEDGYWQEMYEYVKSLGTKPLTTGTQLQYGYWYNQARLDYCDIHAYWNHPNFPRKSWDHNDWLICNSCLANSPCDGTLAALSCDRVMGRPFTCSEYDHPFPNQYCAEGNVMLAAVSAFQDWSATFQFAWSHGDAFERTAASNFFDESTQPVKLAHLPACYGMFVRGDVQKGPGEFVYAPKMSEAKEMEIAREALKGYHRNISKGLGVDRSLSLAVFSGVELTDLNIPMSDAYNKATKIDGWEDLPERCGSKEKKEIVNEFGEIRWNFQEEGKGFFTVDTANTKVFSGFVTKPCEFDALTLDVGETILGWATVSLVKGTDVDPNAVKCGKLTAGRYLLALTGDMKNTDSKLLEIGKDVTNAQHFEGSEGHEPVLCEGIPATLTLKGLAADNVEVYALNARGDRATSVDVQSVGSDAAFSVGPEQQTIWYEIVVK